MATLAGCASVFEPTPPAAPLTVAALPEMVSDYVIGPGDRLQIFVWRNQELSTSLIVRPDGKISAPLIEDLPISGLTPTLAARAIEERLSNFVKDVVVTVVMLDFVGPVERQIRVVGEAARPQALAYRRGMTALDVMVMTGGLTQFAAGNRALLLRVVNDKPTRYRLRLADLVKQGDMTANAELVPGDVILIPQSWF